MRSRGPSQPRGAIRGSGAGLRALLCLALLLAAATGAWAVASAHRARARGIPRAFPAPVSDAGVPVLGVNVALEQYDDAALEVALRRIADGGFVWVRQAFFRSHITGDRLSSSGEFDWSSPDRIVAALARYPQLRLVAVLEDDPPAPPADSESFAGFAAAFAERYGDRLNTYQIWDEPNLAAQWGGGPVSPPAYADLLARTSRAIRAADPGARILLAGLAPTTETGPDNLSDVRYLEQLYEAGAAGHFDVVAAKPYGFDTGPDDRRVDEAVLNFSRMLLLRDVLVENGDAGKAIWASHWGWNALPAGWDGDPSIWGQTDEATQALQTVQALERVRSEWPWVGAMIIENYQPRSSREGATISAAAAGAVDDPRWGFSLVGPDGSPRPVYRALADWAASLPDAAPVGGYEAETRWAAYEGAWRVGPLGADVGRPSGSRAAFRFDGTRVGLTARRGPYRAFLYATVDGKPANALPRDETGRAYVVLYDEVPGVVTVPLATGLEPGVHTVELVAEGGQGQWLLVDWRVGARPLRDGTSWKVAVLAAAVLAPGALLFREGRRINWGALRSSFLARSEWVQNTSVVALTGLVWAAAAASWGYNLELSDGSLGRLTCLVVSLMTVPVLGFLLALRLDLGLAVIALLAPFYLVPGTMFYGALGIPEVLIALCVVAYGILRVACPGSIRSAGDTSGPTGGTKRDGRRQLRGTDLAVALLVLAALGSSAAAVDRLAALFELRTVVLLPALFYVLLRVVPLDGSDWQRIVGGFMLGGVGVALVGLGQWVVGRNLVMAEGGLPRLQSVYASPNNLGLYLGRVWPLLVAGVLWGERGRRRRLCTLALAPVTLALVLSFSRGALLMALPAAVLVMGLLAGGRYRGAAVAFVLAGAVALVPLLQLPRFASLLDLGRGSTFFRLKLWRSCLRMIREHPMFGVGPGNFLLAYRTRYILPAAWEEFSLEHPHNVYLDHWTRLGLAGVVAGVIGQIAFWRGFGRGLKVDPLGLGLAGSMAALLAHGLVDNALFFPDLALTFFLLLGLSVARQEPTNEG